MPTPIAVALVQHAGRYLVGLRGDGVHLAGYSEFPGGRILPAESAEQAAVRECFEETGLAVRATRLRRRTTYHYDHGAVDLSFVDCELLDGTDPGPPRPPFRWVQAAELTGHRFPPANDAVLRELVNESRPRPA
jgi:mutator protein MutT